MPKLNGLKLVELQPNDIDAFSSARLEAAALLEAANKLRFQADELELASQNKLHQAESHARIERRKQLLDAAVDLALELIDAGSTIDEAIMDAAAEASINSRAIDGWVRRIDARRYEMADEERDTIIKRELAAGTPQNEIAKLAKCSEAHVCVIKKRDPSIVAEVLDQKPPVRTRKKHKSMPELDDKSVDSDYEKTILAMHSNGYSINDIVSFTKKSDCEVRSLVGL